VRDTAWNSRQLRIEDSWTGELWRAAVALSKDIAYFHERLRQSAVCFTPSTLAMLPFGVVRSAYRDQALSLGGESLPRSEQN